MNKTVRRGLLIFGILGLLLVYFLTINDLPQRIYTPAQQEFLSTNLRHSLNQSALVVNYISPAGSLAEPGQPALMPDNESRVRVRLDAGYKEQEGVSATVYDLEFEGQYRLIGSDTGGMRIEILFPFPDNLETLHDVIFLVDGKEPSGVSYSTEGIHWQTILEKESEQQVIVRYKASGASSFSYAVPQDQRTPIDVEIAISGLTGGSVAKTSLPGTGHTSDGVGEVFAWKYTGLIADRNIQLVLPARLSFAQRIALLQDDFRMLAWLAPILVSLFMACLAGFLSLARIRFSVEDCLLSGLGLALFYPLLTFASGVLGVALASAVSLVVIAGLELFFFSLVLGWKKTLKPLGILLLVFLGFFSMGTLLPWRGLMLSSGSLLLVGGFMWYYAHSPDSADLTALKGSEGTPAESATGAQTLQQESVITHPADNPVHCLHCGQSLEESHAFCPTCGHSTDTIRLCPHCKQRLYVPQELENIHCIYCGQLGEKM